MIPVSVQLSLGRFNVQVNTGVTLAKFKQTVRENVEELAHLNLNVYCLVLNGGFLGDERKSLASIGVKPHDVFILVKRSQAPAAANVGAQLEAQEE